MREEDNIYIYVVAVLHEEELCLNIFYSSQHMLKGRAERKPCIY